MSNHYHLVLYINQPQIDVLSNLEIIERWRKLYKGPDIIQRYINRESLSKEQLALVIETVNEWQHRLADISWYRCCLNEFIARKANREDHCKGRFWEGRFKSQALLDEQALLTCMAYVELNPLRAKMAITPETSEFTSIKQRIEERSAINSRDAKVTEATPKPKLSLKQFLAKDDLKDQIPYRYAEYLYLVDWTERIVREDKRGAIDESLPPILRRLGIDAKYLCEVMQPKANHRFSRALGCQDKLRAYASKLKIGWIKGTYFCGKSFPA